ncbi:hypothetical protein [Roseateles terrae]|uniref:Uncharacterized protein n=1 Tax=Roseateles terrae TaxID=431060 RepID=A0ABR6GM18_9BURK|nr:hypothetical protein [Roseateles terrae]MBB3193148.1 hypothetical protein [Roseateles terrae]
MSAVVALAPGHYTDIYGNTYDETWKVDTVPPDTGGTGVIATTKCPANSSSCLTGTNYVSVGLRQIPASACSEKAGKSESRNFTVGHSRTSGSERESAWDAAVLKRGADLHNATVCDGTCEGVATFDQSSNAWQSTAPDSNGLYRLSIDLTVTYTGATCTPAQKTPAMDPAAPSPGCDGYVGQINGKTVCVGKVGTSDPIYTAPNPILAGNPAAGSNGSASTGTRTNGTGGAAGGPPSSVDGSIRGGTGSATNGSGGTGSSPSSSSNGPQQEVKVCGTPGNAPCKIDESGTPDGKGAFSSADGLLESASKAREAGMREAGDRKDLPWSPSGILLPAAGCEVQKTETRLGTMPLDLCSSPIAQLWRQLLGWLLYMLTLLYCWRVAGGSIGGGK